MLEELKGADNYSIIKKDPIVLVTRELKNLLKEIGLVEEGGRFDSYITKGDVWDSQIT